MSELGFAETLVFEAWRNLAAFEVPWGVHAGLLKFVESGKIWKR